MKKIGMELMTKRSKTLMKEMMLMKMIIMIKMTMVVML